MGGGMKEYGAYLDAVGLDGDETARAVSPRFSLSVAAHMKQHRYG